MRGTSDYVPVSTLAAAAGIVSREWGEYGYSLAVHYVGYWSTIFELRAGDGGTRLLRVDRYGNHVVAPDGISLSSPSEAWQHWARWADDELHRIREWKPRTEYVPEGTTVCEGHPAGPDDPMGETVYCDGSCQPE